MPGRKYTAGNDYRYGFNGQEKDKDVNVNITTAQFWEYDSRIARRWNIDPSFKSNPSESPYLVFHNNPILFNDLDGDEPPKNFKEHKNTLDGKSLHLPKNATIELYTAKNSGGDKSLIGKIRSFSFGKSRFVNTFVKGAFRGYENWQNNKERYRSPDLGLSGGFSGAEMRMDITSNSIGKDGVSKIIQTVVTNIPVNTAKFTFTEGGQAMVGFVDGGVNAPSTNQGLPDGAEPGTPYFISTLPSFYNGRWYKEEGEKNCNEVFDKPNAQNAMVNKKTGKNITIVTFQTVIVAQNYYGSGQNVVMGVYNWGFRNGAQTHSNGIPSTSTLTEQSLNIIKNDYPNYNLIK